MRIPSLARLVTGVGLAACTLILSGVASAQTPSLTRFDTGPAQPVLTGGGPGSWDQVLREKVTVLKNETGFRMWYAGSSNGLATKIGYATSTDGVNWVKYAGNPIIDRDT